MSKAVVLAGWDSAPHLSDEAKAELLASYRPHERDARSKGVPSLGSGAIYPIAEEEFVVEPFVFPPWYKHAYGLDVGWNRTAGIWGALDPESDVFYLYSEHYRGQAEPPIHAEAIKARGKWIPGVIDPAANGRSQHDGERLLSNYVALDLRLTQADNAVEDGIYRVWTRISTGRLKVFANLQNWLMEYRIYRRDEKGKIVKALDHLMDATRYLVVSGIAIATIRPPDEWYGRPGSLPQAGPKHKSDYDPFSGLGQNVYESYR